MELTLSEGYKLASLVVVTGVVLVVLNARAVLDAGPQLLETLALASAVGVVILGLRLMLDRPENVD